MDAQYVYWIWAVLLVLANAAVWLLNVFALPGNWAIVVLTGAFALFYPPSNGRGVGWVAVLVLLALATAGELIEFAAGAAGAGKQGGSRRGMVLAVVGTLAGSILGAIVLSPVIPVAGSILGAVGGGAAGAFGGAYLGEVWKGRTWQEGIEVGKGALIGRLLGTAGKVIIGAIMVVVSAVAVVV